MKKIFLSVFFILILPGAAALFAQEKVLQVGFAYANSQYNFQGAERGGLAQISMYATKGILRFGGYGDFLLTNDAYLGGGGIQLGIGCNVFDFLRFALLGKAGLGGGKIEGDAGACYNYGAEFSVILQGEKNPGIGIYIAHEEIRNLIKLDALSVNPLGYTSLGIKISFRVTDGSK